MLSALQQAACITHTKMAAVSADHIMLQLICLQACNSITAQITTRGPTIGSSSSSSTRSIMAQALPAQSSAKAGSSHQQQQQQQRVTTQRA
jgi:hypothetical protein